MRPNDKPLGTKAVSELQSGVAIDSYNVIHGTLHHVTDYTDFNKSDEDEQKGNFCALHFEGDGSPITCKTSEGKGKKEVTLDDDGILIFKVDSPAETLTVESGGESTVYKCSGLTLEAGE